jgi:hypothetical protein
MPRVLPALALSLLLAAPGPVLGQDKVDKGELDAALAKGLAWLKALQQPDGSFAIPPGQDSLEKSFPMGYSSLAALTLLKCGVAPDDPIIEKAFQHLNTLPLRKTYSISCLVLAIEARYAPPPKVLAKEEGKAYSTVARKVFRKRVGKADLKKLQECVNWLVTNRSKDHPGGWRYPQGEIDQDNSCTQYALLALKSARRLGVAVPLEVFEQVADFFVAQQDRTGPEVPWFPVPAADGPIAEMLDIEARKKLERKLKKEAEKAAAKAAKTRQRKQRGSEAPGGGTSEQPRLFARGWSYEPRAAEGPPIQAGDAREGPVPDRAVATQRSTGSMTCSGVAALCIAKSELEASKRSWRPREARVNQAIRDGVAWLAHYFNPRENPSSGPKPTVGWKYYYLYSVERAGVLAGTYRFGERDWWEEGAAHLLTQQLDEGAWPDAKGLSKLSRSCFALLFLRRATIPLVPLPPKRVMTGVPR